ncbi:hypothetical protein HF1_09730 [Mycoplasma haemofelis str. Langford 1]|uniref:Uncharacterized protein n=1 Tax=Mycoplasma haemofelis (strain Langford 1) TaxID=941640 RepID=E8ZIL0_MYCHL|nr:hypothetical protein [Mycoplasma haemofelis]CBY92981.1 hypothetical protein HF1_09730 [Mycoplasma haemofelis str. Langford 1]
MSLLPKLGLGFAGLAGASGAGYLGWKHISNDPKESFKSKYSLAVDGFLNDDATLTKKLTSLNGDAATPKHPDLLEAKKHKTANKDADAKASLKKGCSEIHNKPIDSEFFDDFKNYCSFNNGDKIEASKSVVTDNGDFTNKKDAFNGKSADQLQKGFKDIEKPTSSDTTWQAAMLSECKKLASEIFEGEIPNFKEFCTK